MFNKEDTVERMSFPLDRYLELMQEAIAHGDEAYLKHLREDFTVVGDLVFPKIHR